MQVQIKSYGLAEYHPAIPSDMAFITQGYLLQLLLVKFVIGYRLVDIPSPQSSCLLQIISDSSLGSFGNSVSLSRFFTEAWLMVSREIRRRSRHSKTVLGQMLRVVPDLLLLHECLLV